MPAISDEKWQETREALIANGWNISAAARELGQPRKTICNRVKAARARGDICNPETVLVTKAKSTLRDAEGSIVLEWTKTGLDSERHEQLVRETIAALTADMPVARPIPAPTLGTDEAMSAYCIGDVHMGMYAWGDETGDDYDCDIAQRELMLATDRLVASAPATDECLVAQLGDFFHMDDSKNMTPAHHNILDVDTRFQRVIRTGVSTMRYVIDACLFKHQVVRVRNAKGNHDPHASITLQEALRGYYANEPRVIIEDCPRPFWTYRFGKNLVGITHGHTIKPEKMPGVLAVEGRAHWSECEFFYCWHGHIHQKRMFEDMGVLVESFRTLAARDAYAQEHGYRPGRELQCLVLHKDFGEIERHTAGIKRVRHG